MHSLCFSISRSDALTVLLYRSDALTVPLYQTERSGQDNFGERADDGAHWWHS